MSQLKSTEILTNYAGKYTFILMTTEVFSTKNLTNVKIPEGGNYNSSL